MIMTLVDVISRLRLYNDGDGDDNNKNNNNYCYYYYYYIKIITEVVVGRAICELWMNGSRGRGDMPSISGVCCAVSRPVIYRPPTIRIILLCACTPPHYPSTPPPVVEQHSGYIYIAYIYVLCSRKLLRMTFLRRRLKLRGQVECTRVYMTL